MERRILWIEFGARVWFIWNAMTVANQGKSPWIGQVSRATIALE
jgi:hypothetical protein